MAYQSDLDGNNPLVSWYNRHESDYNAVKNRLNRTRETLVSSDMDTAISMFKTSCVNAVMSIQTDKDRHERAFTAHYAGDKSLKEACLMTVYGGQKYEWLQRSFDSFDFERCAMLLQDHKNYLALEHLCDNFTGLSHRKASFTLAMLGFQSNMCIDSNVAKYTDVSIPREFDDLRHYRKVCSRVYEHSGLIDQSPFMVQWCLYDIQRGEHARHLPFYRELLEDV
jgi:hypothetical protein